MKTIDQIKLFRNATLRDAIIVIENSGKGIAYTVDENGKFVGILTDGDIRRAIINGHNLEDKVESIINKDPIVCSLGDSKETILKLAIEKKLYQIPIVDSLGKIVDIEEIGELLSVQNFSNKVVLMVGGLGSRLRPLTNDIPKPLLRVGGKPILERIINDFMKYGFKNFILSVNYKAEMIVDYFGDGSSFGASIEYVFEDEPMGTAGSLSLLRDKLKEPFFVMNGDILSEINFKSMMHFHNNKSAVATMGVREYDMLVPYGVVSIDGSRIKSIEEKPMMTFFVSGGIYILNKKVFDLIADDKYLDMPTLFETLIAAEEQVNSYAISEYWVDIGRKGDFERAQERYN